MSRPPAAASCGPPRPNTSMPGASARSSRVSAPAYRSPEASPHDSSSRVNVSGTGTFEECRIDRFVEGDVGHAAFEHRLTAAEDGGRERDLHAVDRAVVGELLFDQRPVAAAGDVRLLGDEAGVRRNVQDDRLEARARE